MPALVSTDGSARSLVVLPHAARLAAAIGEPITLLRVLDPADDLAGEPAPTLRERVERVSARFETELRAVLADHAVAGDVLVVPLLHRESVPEAILGTATLGNAAFVALDTRGGGSLHRLLFGSTAMDVLRHAQMPLLVTGPDARPPAPSERYHIFMTTDGSAAGDGALLAVAHIAARAGARLTIWQAVEPRLIEMGASPSLAIVRARLQSLAATLDANVSVDVAVEQVETIGEIHGAAIRAAVSQGATCLAMGTHGHSRRFQAVAGSVAMAVIQHSPFPVLLSRSRD